ncbi:hypothetical protein [Candidatus Electronema sp. JC]|uniref:hypothetical protein n=1 Tax=Candidatus Electronema sp. JC TaxID=3401570 RepID=UPI003AA93724
MKNVEWCYLTSKRCGVKGFVQIGAAGGAKAAASAVFPLACGRELIYSRAHEPFLQLEKTKRELQRLSCHCK